MPTFDTSFECLHPPLINLLYLDYTLCEIVLTQNIVYLIQLVFIITAMFCPTFLRLVELINNVTRHSNKNARKVKYLSGRIKI